MISNEKIEQMARDYWMNVLGMAEPKYCVNDSWHNFLKGFRAAEEMSEARIAELESEVRDMVVVIADLLKYHQTLDCCACSKCVGLSLLEKHRTQKETK
jgi:hypothetical protein